MAFALRLFLLLLLAVALPDRAAQAAPWRAQGADWNHHMDYLEVMNDGLKFLEDVGAKPLGAGDAAPQLTPRTESQGGGEVTGVSRGRTLPAPGMVTGDNLNPRRGPPREKTQDTPEEVSLRQSELIRQMLKGMQQGGQGIKQVPVQQETFPEESSDSVPDSAAGREAMPGTVTQDKFRGKVSPIAWLHKVVKPYERPAVTGVSAGRIVPTPDLVTAPKPSSLRSSPPREKTQDTAEEISLRQSELIRQMLKEMQQGGQGMKREPVQQEIIPEGIIDSVPDSAAGREAMPGTVSGDKVPGKVSLLAWLHNVVKPTGPPAVTGVSAERTLPAPDLVTAPKPGSHRSSSPRQKTQDTAEEKSLKRSELIRKMLKEFKQGGQGMKQVPVQQETFPEGSSDSVPNSAAGREAMPGTVSGDLDAGKAPPLAWRYEVLKPSGPPTGVSADRISPAPGLDAAHKPDSHPSVPPTEKTKHTSDKKFQERFEVMWKMLKEMLQGGQEVDEEAVLKAVFPGGSSGSLAASAAGREAMPGTVPGDWDRDMDYVEALVENTLKFLEDIGAKPLGEGDAASQPTPRTEPQGGGEVTGVSAGSASPDLEVATAPKPGSHRRVMDQQAKHKEALPRASSGSLAASAAGKKTMPGTGPDTGDSDAGKAPPLAWWYEVLKPSGPPTVTGVSADRISPAPGLDAAHKPGSHPSVPPTEKTKYTPDKKFQERFEVMWKMLKEMLQGGQEVEEEVVLKAVFPGGSSGSLAASAAGREAMPGTVPGDWDRDMDYVEALVENALKFLEDVGAKPLGAGDAAPQPTSRTEPQGGGEVTGVSAGSALPAPGMLTADKPGSHRRVMDQQPKHKEALRRASSGSLAASATGKKTMPGTGPDTGDSDAGKAPPLAWWYEVLKPSGPPTVTGVSEERISPAPGLDAAHKPGSHPSVPPTEKTKYTSDKKSQERFEVMWKMLKEMLQGGQEVEEEVVLKAVFPGGSSGSLAASAAGREAMPGTVLGDWDRDMDYVEALVENTLKFLEDVGAKGLGAGDAASQLTPRTERQGGGEVTGVSAGSGLPAPGMLTADKPGSHRRVMDQQPKHKEALRRASSGSLAASATGKKTMPGTAPDTGDAASTTQVPDSQKVIERAFCQGMFCWIELIAGVLCLEIIFMLCCFGIWYACKRKR
ncbi:uncharacterized protein LOC111945973 isoform X3 [Cyanistes caeruleus]|uniref:uncharacterized protein LOC111945973 isoform X3 n=1 Tax=Cyanistes caeruleus TaxID=156563 RepID=UPI000CDB2523|nr:uncharacterized protein LOC111945973 isoform X3 [Cyanistes caeruleus]